MIYQNDDMKIRPFSRYDMTDQYRDWMHDTVVTKYNSHGLFALTDEAKERFWKEIDNEHRIVWAILAYGPITRGEITFDGWKHIGQVSLQSLNWINRSCELAIVIGEPDLYKKGIGTQACRWVVDHAFEKLGMNRVYSGTAACNLGMRNVALKVGMIQEGVFLDGMWLNGRFEDVRAFGITKRMWEGAK